MFVKDMCSGNALSCSWKCILLRIGYTICRLSRNVICLTVIITCSFNKLKPVPFSCFCKKFSYSEFPSLEIVYVVISQFIPPPHPPHPTHPLCIVNTVVSYLGSCYGLIINLEKGASDMEGV